MVITLTRSGGFTGIPLKKTIDTATLPPKEKKKIESLVTQAKVSLLQKKNPHPNRSAELTASPLPQDEGNQRSTTSMPDRFVYSLSIQDQFVSREVQLSEESLSGPLQELINLMSR